MLLRTVKFALCAVIVGSAILGLGGCAKKGGGSGEYADGEGVNGASDNIRFYGSSMSPEQEKQLLGTKTYYFGYDRFDLSDSDLMSVYAHAKRICSRGRIRVRIEGHTDERGSREYNVALGERRAKAIANILMLKGVGQDQISVVSYGKEKPAAFGSDEAAWSKNRRAVIVYEVE
jgi:peptidoglycan-associated lipoprotein